MTMSALANTGSDFTTLQAQVMAKRAETDAATFAKSGNNTAAVQKIAQHFEGMFLSTMMQTMFDQVPTDGLMGGGSAEKMWRSMQVQEYGSIIAKAGGVGVADAVERQLLTFQEVPSS